MHPAVRRNTILLAAGLAANSGMLQLQAAVASLTLVLVLDAQGLLGLGPAIVLASGAVVALPAGRAMDRFGRVPVLAAGYATGIIGSVLAALGSATAAAPMVLLGLACVGAASGTALLSRAAAADMYPPERRARGIGLVLFGAVFGAILGPTVFSPLIAGRELDGDAMAVLWLAAAGMMAAGLALTLAIRTDPREIARQMQDGDAPGSAAAAGGPGAAGLWEIVRRPGVVPALVAAQASFAVMVGVMTLTGAIVVQHHGHAGHHVFPIIAAHVVGMYALVLVVGRIIDQVGRTPCLVGGLVLMAMSTTALTVVESVGPTALVLFALGLGWNFAFLSATAQLADRTQADERGRLLGLNDLLSGATGATFALAGGLTLSEFGVTHLAVGATVLVVLPALWIGASARGPRPAPATG